MKPQEFPCDNRWIMHTPCPQQCRGPRRPCICVCKTGAQITYKEPQHANNRKRHDWTYRCIANSWCPISIPSVVFIRLHQRGPPYSFLPGALSPPAWRLTGLAVCQPPAHLIGFSGQSAIGDGQASNRPPRATRGNSRARSLRGQFRFEARPGRRRRSKAGMSFAFDGLARPRAFLGIHGRAT